MAIRIHESYNGIGSISISHIRDTDLSSHTLLRQIIHPLDLSYSTPPCFRCMLRGLRSWTASIFKFHGTSGNYMCIVATVPTGHIFGREFHMIGPPIFD